MSNNHSKKTKALTSSGPDIEGFNIKINEFGEIVCTHSMDKINDFLDENVEDKKLLDREEGDQVD